MLSKVRTTLLEKCDEMEAAQIALYRDRSDCSGDGEAQTCLRDGVRALIAAGPPATLRVKANFDWGEAAKDFDARDGEAEDGRVLEILEYFTVQNLRKG
jgi:hypothetical protein